MEAEAGTTSAPAASRGAGGEASSSLPCDRACAARGGGGEASRARGGADPAC